MLNVPSNCCQHSSQSCTTELVYVIVAPNTGIDKIPLYIILESNKTTHHQQWFDDMIGVAAWNINNTMNEELNANKHLQQQGTLGVNNKVS